MASKAELIKFLREAAGLSVAQSAVCVNGMVEWLALTLEQEGRVELRGLGSFFVKQSAAHKAGINNEMVTPAHGRVVFRPCEKLRRAVWDKKR